MSDLLKHVQYEGFNSWDVKQYITSLVNSNYSVVYLGNYIQEEKTKIKPFEYPSDNFKILGVNNKIGLFDNETKKGIEINQPYKIVEDGFLAFNPYRINVGSIGLKTSKQEFNLISPAYVVFSGKKELLPEYLFLIFKTKTFNKIIRDNTKGSVRQILSFDILERLKIPLPPLEIQQQLVKNYQDKLNLTKQSEQKEAEIETYLYQQLGIELPQKEKQNTDILQFVWFKDLDYWSIDKIHKSINLLSNKYHISNINDACSIITDGTHQTPTYTKNGVIFLSAKNVTKEIINWDDIKYVSLEDHNNYCKRVQPSKGDILLAKNGTTGVAAIVDEDRIFSIYVSLAILRPIQDKISANYLLTLINSPILRCQFFAKLVGVGVPNLHLREIKEVKIPLPPLKIQNQIAHHIQNLKNEIQTIKQQAEQNQENALNEFEAEIFTRQASIENNNAS